jgi:NTE family protein
MTRGLEGFGVALGGGTARGLAHVGVLKVLEAHGRAPDALAGTSSGAIVAAMWALGASALEIEHQVRQLDLAELWRQALDPGLFSASLIKGRRLQAWLDRKYFYGATFADLRRPLAVACTDVGTGDLVVLRSGSLARAVVASCALPGYFAPVHDDGRVLVDGGFVEAVPFAALQGLGVARMLGVHAGIDADRSRVISFVRRWTRASAASRSSQLPPLADVGNPWRVLARGLRLAAYSYQHRVVAPPNGVVVRVLPKVAWWDFHRSPEAIAAGERAMLAALADPAVATLTGVPA